MFKLRLSIFFILFNVVFIAHAQRGKDGNKLVNSPNVIINEYTVLSLDAFTGNTSITVQNSNLNTAGVFTVPLTQGDLLLIIQMKGGSITGNTFTDINNITYGLPKDSSWGAFNTFGNAGNYELTEVSNVPDPQTIELSCPLRYDYSQQGAVQVIRVPRYQDFTVNNGASVTCPAWDGVTGGVVAAEVNGNTVINGTIESNAKGFRGGVTDNQSGFGSNDVACTDNSFGGEKGEGIAGYQSEYNIVGGRYCKGAPGNGGGGGNRRNGGGGGGANAGDPSLWIAVGNPSLAVANWANAWNLEWPGLATATSSGGGKGGYTAAANNQNALTTGPGSAGWGGDLRSKQGGYGGRPLDYSTGKIFMGGGGGAGDGDDGYAGRGGNGGGIVYLTCFGTVSGSGSLQAIGENGTNSFGTATLFTVAGNDGAGGGGAGGAILLNALGAVSGITVEANGGNGGNQDLSAGALYGAIVLAEGPGGGGGGGYFNCSQPYAANVSGGANGTTDSPSLSEFPPNGATAGGAGETANSLSLYDIVLTDDSTCAGNTVTLTASVIGNPPAGGIMWFDSQYGGNLIVTGNTFTTPPMFATFTFWVGTCPGNFRKPVTVTVTPLVSTALAGNDQQICDDSTSLAANVPLNGTGTWSVISGTATILSPNDPNSPLTGLSLGTVQLQWTISSPGCPSSSDLVDINVLGSLSQAAAGTDQQICASTTAISAVNPVNGTGAWSVFSGGGTVVNTAAFNTSVNGLTPGINELVWTVSNGICPVNTDTVIIMVDENPSPAYAGADLTVCSDSVQLAAQIPLIGSGIWTLDAGTGTIASPITAVTDILNLSPGNNTFIWTVSNGVCPAVDDTILIVVAGNLSAAQAGSDQSVCGDVATLAAVAPVNGTGSWSVIGGSGNVSNPSDPASGVNSLSPGLNVLVWTVSNAICPDNTDTVTVQSVIAGVAADAGTDQTICTGNTTLSGNTPTQGTGLWTIVSGSGIFNDASLPAATISGLTPGTVTLSWTITNGPCPPTTDNVTITVLPAVSTAQAGSDVNICAATYNLQATPPVVGTGSWTILSGSGNLSSASDPNAVLTGLTTGTVVLEWTVTSPGCPPSTDQLTIVVADFPTPAVAGPDQEQCTGNFNLSANTPVLGNGYWSIASGSANFTANNIPNPGVQVMSPGGAVLVWNIASGNCPVSSDTLVLTISNSSTAANAGPDVTILLGDSVQLNGSGGTVNLWTPPLGLSCFDCADPWASPLFTTTYTVEVVDANGCLSFDSVIVEVDTTISYFLPNAFSPNGNDEPRNEILRFHGTGVDAFNLRIFDRWGNKVFETSTASEGWDGTYKGKECNAGIYMYYLEVNFRDGTFASQKGDINLLR